MNHPFRISDRERAAIRINAAAGICGKKSLLQKGLAVALLAVMVFGLNFHLFILQLYGWSGMILDYREATESWTAAADQTLSGEAPCEICAHVEIAIVATDSSLSDLSLSSQLPFLSWLFLLAADLKPLLTFPPVPSSSMELPWVAPARLAFSPDAPPPRFASA